MESDLIRELRYRIEPLAAWKSAVPDERTIYTFMEIPQAHAELERKFAPHKVIILAYSMKRFLPTPSHQEGKEQN